MRTLIFAFLLLVFGVSAHATAPQWLRDTDVYNGWYRKWDDAAIEKMRGLPFVVGVPLDKAVIDKAHRAGVKVLGYITYYQMPPGQVYQNEDLAKHKDWNVILADGSEEKSIFEGTENTGWKTMCPNSPGYRAAALKYTKFMMDLGLDGIFVDNGHPGPACYGPKFGRHKHIYPGTGLDKPYGELLNAVKALVRSYGSEKIMFVNTCAPRTEWAGGCDGMMTESYIYSWAWQGSNQTDKQLLERAAYWKPLIDAGDVVLALTYLDNPQRPVRDAAFYSYAWSRISGFLWADWFTGWPDTSVLYKLRLGPAQGPMDAGDGCWTRRFANAIVGVTAQDTISDFRIKAKRVFDVYSARHLNADSSGEITVTIPPASGRVYLLQ